MLEELSVRNFAPIDSLTLGFEGGFNVLSGETGAGKSIIVGSLSFLLGGKADAGLIRAGAEEAAVVAVVAVAPGNQDARSWLASRDIPLEDGRVIARRSIKKNGRTTIFLQNVPVTRTDLAEFMAFLFDLHGQHTHETLLRRETHRVYLDRFAGLEEEAAAFNRLFTALQERRRALEASLDAGRNRDARLELLAFGVEEITRADPRPGESRELEAEAQRLGGFEKLLSQSAAAAEALFEGEPSLLSLTRRARSALEGAAAVDGTLAPLLTRLEDLFYEAEDLSGELRSYRDGLVYDPRRLEEVEERRDLLHKLKKKYSAPGSEERTGAVAAEEPEEKILAWKAAAEAEIEALSGAEEHRGRLREEIARREKELIARAAALSARRREGAKRLDGGITAILGRLGMPNARFETAVASKGVGEGARDRDREKILLGPWGADDVEFLISANTGEPLRELARIASGGELSRVMLAIKTVLSGEDAPERDVSPETLVFDEIDTGIGGEVARSVGEYLAQIGQRKQIFCVTHLASIAVQARNHLKVEKRVEAGEGGAGERTVTRVVVLGPEARRQEIARMLSGDGGSAALAHAGELLAAYDGTCNERGRA